ncbi:mycofactocin precursor MftA [Actinomadura violacea]|uniref:Mycofactocin n=1 Tax=Actinomadura violacea TaxID=2819934 RepID=A0ABS3RZA6_9ACTN|nr:mycofactocin precursor MftA [Actinomadura violacea]MBO2462094.1 mycofactocin precursor [Actinomadura violacea]
MENTAPQNQAAEQADDRAQDIDVAESLIEEVSIDGMCGVY